MNKLLIICGPTATGKTKLGINLAKLFNGEIISADSRQVYKGMDVVTGKDLPVNIKTSSYATSYAKASEVKKATEDKQNSYIKYNDNKLSFYLFDKIPVWGLDLVKPDEKFSVAHFVKFCQVVLNDIWFRKKLPIIVGGTGFWIKALLDGVDSLGIPPDWQLREKLRNLEINKLREMLANTCPERLRGMNNSDRNNPRRLIRAIEVTTWIKNHYKPNMPNNPNKTNYELLKIGLRADNITLYKLIDDRVKQRVKQGAQQEVEKLINHGYSWDLSSFTACGYKEWQLFFNHKQSLKDTLKHWKNKEHAYSRRQLTWFKKDKKIIWFDINKRGWQINMVKFIKSWYYK